MAIVNPWLLSSAGTLLGLAAAVGIVNTAAAPVRAQEPLSRVLTVTGEGRESIPATLARVQLGVSAQGPAAEPVQQDIARRSSAVIEFLRSNDVEQLQTTGIRLNPQYSYTGNQPRITGYSGSNTVSFELPTEQVGSVLDDAIAAGANRISSVSFMAADEALSSARDIALQEAAADAQAQADVVLQSLNLSAQEIVSIQVNNPVASTPRPFTVRAASISAESTPNTPVEAGEQTVNARVTLQIRY